MPCSKVWKKRKASDSFLWVSPLCPSYLPVLAPGARDSVPPAFDLSLRFETKVFHPEVFPAHLSVAALLRSQVCLQLPRWNEIKTVLLQEFCFLIDAGAACFPPRNIQPFAHFFQQLGFHLSFLPSVPPLFFLSFFWTTTLFGTSSHFWKLLWCVNFNCAWSRYQTVADCVHLVSSAAEFAPFAWIGGSERGLWAAHSSVYPPRTLTDPAEMSSYHVYRIRIERQSLSAHLSAAFRHL